MILNKVRSTCLIGLATAGLLLAACSSTTTTQSFRKVQNPRVAASQIAVGADFGKYDRLNAVDMGIFFPSHVETSPEDQARIRQIFRDAFLSRLTGYDIVRNQPGPSTLTVQATLIDFRNATVDDVMSVRPELRDMARPGSLVFLMELKDSRSEAVLARAADSAAAPAFATSAGTKTDWPEVEAAAAHWADLFRQFLDQNLNQ
ncbi:MAG: DUF3313 family protein [Gammaproteobacteria bacterium]|jgi:hypothetical protein|nr:DUF3313 family protein [Gammaproteobacteria bacterium]